MWMKRGLRANARRITSSASPIAKARFVAQYADRSGDPAIVIGADTVVVAEGQILGKPADAEDARRMLRLLSGRDHDVLTGLSFLSVPAGSEAVHVESTRVSFLPLSDEDIEDYIAYWGAVR